MSSKLVGNERQRKQLAKYIKSVRPTLVYGEPGIGKTASVYEIAESKGYEVVEFNASDNRRDEFLEWMLKRVTVPSLHLVIYLIDEADGLNDNKQWSRIIRESQNPVVFTANELNKVPKAIRNHVTTLKYYAPPTHEISKLLKQPMAVNSDVRNTLLSAEYGGELKEDGNDFELVERVLKNKPIRELSETDKDRLLVWLVDNLPHNYTGKDVWDNLRILKIFDETRRQEVLELLKKGEGKVNVRFPYFFQR